MSDIELVIRISEETINEIKNNAMFDVCISSDIRWDVTSAIENSIPLPKGHGDLKDELDLDLFAPGLGIHEYVNDLMAKHNIDYVNGDDEDKVRTFATDLIHSCMNVIKTAPTIIEADREV